MSNYKYIGSELDLFAEALNWKAYCRHILYKHLGSKVLEVGAGIGSTTASLCQGSQEQWICLEPDPSLAKQLRLLIENNRIPQCCEVRVGTLSDVSYEEKFDTIIYIDVLEHIENDEAEVIHASQHLEKGGKLLVLAPAHQWLYTPFDEAIGHYRRYNKKKFSIIVPERLQCLRMSYLDCVGLLASVTNRFFLRSRMPTRQQIDIWDKIMVPVSRCIDPVVQYSVGKSIVGIWQKND